MEQLQMEWLQVQQQLQRPSEKDKMKDLKRYLKKIERATNSALEIIGGKK